MIDTIYIIAILLIGVIATVIIKKISDNRYFNSEEYKLLVTKINGFLEEVENEKRGYFRHSRKERLTNLYEDVRKKLNKNKFRENIVDEVKRFIDMYDNFDLKVKDWNDQYVKRELSENKDLFSNIDGKSLDQEQRMAVVVDEDNNLVIAGAGSGKTLTISGKVKYLADRKKVNSDNILLLSFTRKAANEMQERISEKLNINVEAKTFHKLGLEIISNARGYRPDINSNSETIIDKYFDEKIFTDKEQINELIQFFSYYLNIPVDLNEVENLGEAYDYYQKIDLETIKSKIERLRDQKNTIKNERVNSFEEVVIANYLYLNGIRYEYEKVYPYPQNDKYRKRYRPDFYLVDYDIYLEHFGITEDGKAPWLNRIEEKKYVDGIRWKRELHKENKTKLIETYSYYFSEGRFINEFQKLLKENGVAISPIDHSDVYHELFIKNNNQQFEELVKLTKTFIDLFKSNGYTIDQFEILSEQNKKNKNQFFRDRNEMFLSLVKPLYLFYQNELAQNDLIDFNDMINMASEYVIDEQLNLNLQYIIIDEFQDMSMSRYKLIKALKDKTDARLMCVGDDWQSIYRFAGSDIDIFVNFEKYFGYTELLRIQKTYRNSQELLNVASKFITKNPKQIKKDLKSDKNVVNPLRLYGYDEGYLEAFTLALEDIVETSGHSDVDVLLIGRTKYDLKVFEEKDDKEELDNKAHIGAKNYRVIKAHDEVRIEYNKYPELNMTFLTAHRSKGVESENVIILNLKNDLLGFPNKISDDPVLRLVLTDDETFSYAEERRLFYVAITRTKNKVYLITPQYRMSTFAEELMNEQNINYDFKTDEAKILDNPNCPRCEKGHLVIRKNSISDSLFLGCTNYPLCDNTYKDIDLLDDQVMCNACGGFMVKRKGKYGEFYGCTNFPTCENTYRIDCVGDVKK